MADLISNEDPQPTSLLSQHETYLTVGPPMEGIYDELNTSRPLTHIVLLAWNMLPLAALCFQSQLSPQLPLNNVERSHCGHVDNCAELKQKQWISLVLYSTVALCDANKVVLSCCNKPLTYSLSLWLTRHARVGPEPTVPSDSHKHIKRNVELLGSYNTLSIALVCLLVYAIALIEYEKKQAFVDANQHRKVLVPDLTDKNFNETLAEVYGQSHQQGVALLPSWITQKLPYSLQLVLNWWMPNDHARKFDLFGSPTIATPNNHYGMVGIWLTLHFLTIYGELLNVSNSATNYLQYHQQNGDVV
ncbi:MAG: hypothetical protein ISQ13_02905 [Candidatus Margulisbacteria bacterium]|nr:hypothetical protein [Candidatus Margulisiibacteriota bacterium]